MFFFWPHCLPVYGAYGLQHPHSGGGLPIKPLPYVVGVGPCPVFKQHLSGLAGPGQRLQQVLYFIGGAEGA